MFWVWFLLWFGLSTIVLGTFGWSTYILLKQKKAWETFAKRHKLKYTKGRFLESPVVTGMINNYSISMFAAQRQTADPRDRKILTGIEIKFPEGIVDAFVAGTSEMLPFMQSLSLLHPYPVKSDKWSQDYKIFGRNDSVLETYFSAEILDSIVKILSTKNADVLLLVDDNEAFLRLETSDPLQDSEKIETIFKRLLGYADKIRITEAQSIQFKAIQKKEEERLAGADLTETEIPE